MYDSFRQKYVCLIYDAPLKVQSDSLANSNVNILYISDFSLYLFCMHRTNVVFPVCPICPSVCNER